MKVLLLLLPLIAAVFTAPEARWEAKEIISIYLPPIFYHQFIVRLFVLSFPPTKSVCTFDQIHLRRMRSWDAWSRHFGQDGRNPNPCERRRFDFTLHLISNALQEYLWGMRISKKTIFMQKKLFSKRNYFHLTLSSGLSERQLLSNSGLNGCPALLRRLPLQILRWHAGNFSKIYTLVIISILKVFLSLKFSRFTFNLQWWGTNFLTLYWLYR